MRTVGRQKHAKHCTAYDKFVSRSCILKRKPRKTERYWIFFMQYSLKSNISAKNYKYRLMCVEVIVCYISVVFLRHSVVLFCAYVHILAIISLCVLMHVLFSHRSCYSRLHCHTTQRSYISCGSFNLCCSHPLWNVDSRTSCHQSPRHDAVRARL